MKCSLCLICPPLFSGASGGDSAHHLRILGSAASLAGDAQPVPHPHGFAEGADAAPEHARAHAASRRADAGRLVAKRHHTKSRDHLLVLHAEAAREHAQEPHRDGTRASGKGNAEHRVYLHTVVAV